MVAAAEPSSSAGTKIRSLSLGAALRAVSSTIVATEAGSARFQFHWLNVESRDLLQDWIGTAVSASGKPCEPFIIGTSVPNHTTFQLKGTLLGSTTVLILLPSSVTFSAVSLPFCQRRHPANVPEYGHVHSHQRHDRENDLHGKYHSDPLHPIDRRYQLLLPSLDCPCAYAPTPRRG